MCAPGCKRYWLSQPDNFRMGCLQMIIVYTALRWAKKKVALDAHTRIRAACMHACIVRHQQSLFSRRPSPSCPLGPERQFCRRCIGVRFSRHDRVSAVRKWTYGHLFRLPSRYHCMFDVNGVHLQAPARSGKAIVDLPSALDSLGASRETRAGRRRCQASCVVFLRCDL